MIHIEGFEQFANDPAPFNALVRAEYEPLGNWAVVAGRQGTHGIAGQQTALIRRAQMNEALFSVGFAHAFNGRGSAAWLKIGEQQVVLWLHPDTGLPYLNDKPGGALPVSNRWYYYELELNRTTGVVTLAINNRVDMQYTLESPPAGEEIEVGIGYVLPHVYRPDVQPVPVDGSTKTYDDFYMKDGARFGPVVVSTRFPSTDQHVEWFRADLDKTHSQSLSLRPPKPLDNYVAANTMGDEDRFTSSQALANDNPVIATGLVVLARKAPTLNAKLGVFIEGAGLSSRAETTEVTSDWVTHYLFFGDRPADTPEAITNSQFGITVSPP